MAKSLWVFISSCTLLSWEVRFSVDDVYALLMLFRSLDERIRDLYRVGLLLVVAVERALAFLLFPVVFCCPG